MFLLALLERTVRTVDSERYHHALVEAAALAPHEKDVPYFALALHADIPIWSDETAFRAQDIVPVHTTNRLFGIYE